MQSIYAMHQTGSDDMAKEEKFLSYSIESIQDLYLIMLSSLIELQKKEAEYIAISSKKHLATPEERKPNTKFIDNAVLVLLKDNKAINDALAERKINNWTNNDDTILLLLQDVKQSELYQKYMSEKGSTFEKDKQFLIDLFTEVVAPNEKLYNYLEDFKLTWVDDIPVVNTQIVKQLAKISEKEPSFRVSKLFKDEEDKEFVNALFRKTVLNETEFEKDFFDKTPNWDMDRIAEMDTIIIKMAICEFLKFPSIPTKVTINEYLEIAKEYSTPKSSIFINGILDNLVKDFSKADRIKKVGRGLL